MLLDRFPIIPSPAWSAGTVFAKTKRWQQSHRGQPTPVMRIRTRPRLDPAGRRGDWLHLLVTILGLRGQGLVGEGRTLVTYAGLIEMQVEFGNQNRISEALEKSWCLVGLNFFIFKRICDL